MLMGKYNDPHDKILHFEEALEMIQKKKSEGLHVVLAQGALDVLHIGHIEYLRSAKEKGDVLFVGIENDESIRLNKGHTRPFNNLKQRLEFLSELKSVDYVFAFDDSATYEEDIDVYTARYKKLQPTSIAVSSWDPNVKLKYHQAKKAGVQISLVNQNQEKIQSTTNILKLIGHE